MKKSITPRIIGELVGFVRAPRNSAGRKRKLEKERFRLQNVACWRKFPEIGEGKNHRCVVCIKKKPY